ncbi:RICIN domain-containing protein, partial [Micromonospora sp. NPDC048830]|uniref:RICIN domain-containing protein n=1 Tax=Micromonospora sp. NPDC048830 TaxID=3364257 RepID=UPI003723E9C4
RGRAWSCTDVEPGTCGLRSVNHPACRMSAARNLPSSGGRGSQTCNGTGAQQFTLNAAGDLVNLRANKCVDIKDWNGGDGARLQLWDCAGTANQKWRKG